MLNGRGQNCLHVAVVGGGGGGAAAARIDAVAGQLGQLDCEAVARVREERAAAVAGPVAAYLRAQRAAAARCAAELPADGQAGGGGGGGGGDPDEELWRQQIHRMAEAGDFDLDALSGAMLETLLKYLRSGHPVVEAAAMRVLAQKPGAELSGPLLDGGEVVGRLVRHNLRSSHSPFSHQLAGT